MSEFVRASRLYDVSSRTPIAHPAHHASDADVRRALEAREVRADGGQSLDGTERPTCTDPTCNDDAKYAYWMPEMGDFSRARAPEKPDLSDGDLCPYVCKTCRDWRINNGRYDAERFVDPREKLIADGGQQLSAETDHSSSHSENSTRRQGGDSGR